MDTFNKFFKDIKGSRENILAGTYFALDNEYITHAGMTNIINSRNSATAYTLLHAMRSAGLLIQAREGDFIRKETLRGRPDFHFFAAPELSHSLNSYSAFLESEGAMKFQIKPHEFLIRALQTFATAKHFQGKDIRLRHLSEATGHHRATVLNMSLRACWIANAGYIPW